MAKIIHAKNDELGDNDVVELDEYELHDLCATWYHLDIAELENGPAHGVKLVLRGGRYTVSEETRKVVEDRVNACIQEMHAIDVLIHQDGVFWYTC